ncbi:hypothetical protein Q428_14055 [Fervidicella metallireducens AeB]|uniref:Uncharacterized protein n=1 Tax=Fervidicella metallireducens AeB TaxID=1403537 RepID=A0A017RS57_9CLOT|nr:hypothetical protein [Fervidicella metallireducens]EYE87304.1 hypothetical protein Q428_14055 [Fervidicella metallireducens AeB]
MELIIEQSKFKLNYEYKVYASSELIYIAKINRNIIPSLRKIYLYESNGKEVCCLKQENWLKFILQNIPFVNFLESSICDYVYYKNGIKEGYLREKTSGDSIVIGKIKGQDYEMFGYEINNIPIYWNKKQTGVIKRKNIKELDGDQYKIIYNNSLPREVAVIFCLLSDVLWHTSDTRITSCSWEYSIPLAGEKVNKDWVPEDL